MARRSGHPGRHRGQVESKDQTADHGPAVWGAEQLVTGALSDRWGRKWLTAGGMALKDLALAAVPAADSFAWWAAAAVLLADAYGLRAAVWFVAALTAVSALVVVVRMYETHRPTPPPDGRAGDRHG